MAVKLGKRKKILTKQPALASAAQFEDEIHRFTSLGKFAKAVQLAENYAAAHSSPSAECLLLQSRTLQIQSLLDARRSQEAGAKLSDLLRQHPAEAPALSHLELRLQAQRGEWEAIFRPLGDASIDPARRALLEEIVKNELLDLDNLAQTPWLPNEHPLKRAAQTLWRAFEEVTRGPATPVLPDIPRRSPLAPWCLLIKAIVNFHAGDDAGCHLLLTALPPRCAAALAVPLLRQALAGESGDPFVQQLTGGRNLLAASLDDLDRVFHQKVPFSKVRTDIERVILLCKETAPSVLDRLRQVLSVRGLMLGWSADKLRPSLAGSVLRDSFFWGFMARASQSLGSEIVETYVFSEEFRLQSRHEGRLKPQEEAILLLDMVALLTSLPENERPDCLGPIATATIRGYYEGQPEAVRAASVIGSGRPPERDYFKLPRLFQRACALDPQPENFARWLEFEKSRRRGAPLDAAEAWHRFRPEDIRPVLALLELHEKSGAVQKAQGYLDKAQRLDPLDPRLQETRLRLGVAGVLRFFRLKKVHLAIPALDALAALPDMQTGNRPALVAALRCLSGSPLTCVATLVGSQSLAAALVGSLAQLAKLNVPPGCGAPKLAGGEIAYLGNLVATLEEFRVEFYLPESWETGLLKQFAGCGQALNNEALESLTRAALSQDFIELTFACTGLGLRRGGPGLARHLFWRSQAVPLGPRLDNCLCAAAQLAREQRQLALLAEIVDHADSELVELEPCPPEVIHQIVKEEQSVKKYCDPDGCNCKKCQAQKRPLETGGLLEFFMEAFANQFEEQAGGKRK